MSEQVVFRRIRGRVVPVKVARNDVDETVAIYTATGAAASAGGVGARMGHLAFERSRLKRQASKAASEAMKSYVAGIGSRKPIPYSLWSKTNKDVGKLADVTSKMKTLKKISIPVIAGGTVASAILGYSYAGLSEHRRGGKPYKASVDGVVGSTLGPAVDGAIGGALIGGGTMAALNTKYGTPIDFGLWKASKLGALFGAGIGVTAGSLKYLYRHRKDRK